MLRKAKEMGLSVSPVELNQYLMSLNLDRQLTPVESRMIEQSLLREKLQILVGAAAKATPAEINLAYATLHERMTIEMVEFDVANWKEPIVISDADAQAYFDVKKNKEGFRLPKQTKVRYVLFSIAAAEKNVKLTDDEVARHYEKNRVKFEDADGKVKPFDMVKEDVRKDLLIVRAERDAGDQANDFSTRVAPEEGKVKPSFTNAAAVALLTVQETEFFGPMDEVKGVKAGQAFQQEAFSLTADSPCSNPVQGEDGYYVLQLAGNKPREIPPFEKVKEKVVARLKQEKTHEVTLKRGQEMLDKVRQAMTAGKSFDAACKDLQLTAKTYGPTSMADEKTELPAVALGLTKGATSDFIRTATGGLFFCVKDRLPPDPNADSLQREQLARMILEQNRQAIFQNWIDTLVQQEQVDFGPPRSQQASPVEPMENEEEPVQGS